MFLDGSWLVYRGIRRLAPPGCSKAAPASRSATSRHTASRRTWISRSRMKANWRTNSSAKPFGEVAAWIGEVAAWIYDHIGMEIPSSQARFDVYRNQRDGLNCEGRIYYRGPVQPGGSLPRVKLDLTACERIVHPPDYRLLSHPYTDRPQDGSMTVRCYAFEEVFGEKIRALVGRTRPTKGSLRCDQSLSE